MSNTNEVYIEGLTVTTLTGGGGGGGDLQSTTVTLAESSAGPQAVPGFPNSGSYTVYVSAGSRQTATFFVSRASTSSDGFVNRLSISTAAGVTARVNATWAASASFSLVHSPTDGAGATPTYTVSWIGAA